MMTTPDVAVKLTGDDESHMHHYAFKRWYTPLPMIHFVGMLIVLSMTTFVYTVVVLGSSKPPTTGTIIDIFKFGRVDGALLMPVFNDELCQDPSGLTALKILQYVHFAGTPLGVNSGKKLALFVKLVPLIGSTEVGGYFHKIRNDIGDWDYIEFNTNARAEFEPRTGNLCEQVFHPTRKGLFKIVGRTDDYIPFSHGDGLYASIVEREIERHELVQAALVGGHGQPKPVLLIETIPEAHIQGSHAEFMQSLLPYLEKSNSLCHDSVRILPELVLLAQPEKPFCGL